MSWCKPHFPRRGVRKAPSPRRRHVQVAKAKEIEMSCPPVVPMSMSRAKQGAERKRRGKAVPVLGAAGLSLTLASGASAATEAPVADVLTHNAGVSHEITLSEEEISDVSLATFYVFDKKTPEHSGRAYYGWPWAAGAVVLAVPAAVAVAAGRAPITRPQCSGTMPIRRLVRIGRRTGTFIKSHNGRTRRYYTD